MGRSQTFDVAKLVQPISAKRPAGRDLRTEASPKSPYYLLRDERAKARAIERRLVLDEGHAGSPQANWRAVLDLAPQVIANESKDLELAAYLIEALVREKGFSGLRDGFRLVRELVAKCWDHLYPQPDEEGVATRVAHLTGLNGVGSEGTLIRPIMAIPITANTSVGRFCAADYQQAQHLATQPIAEQQRRLSDGALSLNVIQQAVAETPREFYDELLADIREAREEFENMCAVLDEHCGEANVHSSHIRNAIESCLESVRYLIGDSQLLGEPTAVDVEQTTASSVSCALRQISSRGEALQALVQVADYFRRTEPHSPISYGAEQLVRWSQTPLPKLLSELIPDKSARDHIFTLTGMRQAD